LLIVKSIAIFLRAEEIKKIAGEFFKSNALQVLIGTLATMLGILLVMVHNTWNTTPQAFVSLIAWGVLFKGLLFLWSPAEAKILIDDFIVPSRMRIAAVVIYAIGAYLVGIGFGLV
jgi:hypothetical protein